MREHRVWWRLHICARPLRCPFYQEGHAKASDSGAGTRFGPCAFLVYPLNLPCRGPEALTFVMANYYPLEISPEDYKTISGVCKQYAAVIQNPRRDAGGLVPGYEDSYLVWTPTEGDDNETHWGNFKSEDGLWIRESHSTEKENSFHVGLAQSEAALRRIVYWRERRGAPFHFIGVYQVDPQLSRLCGLRIYRRISDTLPALEII